MMLNTSMKDAVDAAIFLSNQLQEKASLVRFNKLAFDTRTRLDDDYINITMGNTIHFKNTLKRKSTHLLHVPENLLTGLRV